MPKPFEARVPYQPNEQPISPDKHNPRISYSIYFAAHTTVIDLAGLAQPFSQADIYITEAPGWNRETMQAFNAVSKGKMSPGEALPLLADQGSSTYFARQQELRIIHNSKKPVATADVHSRSKINRSDWVEDFYEDKIKEKLQDTQVTTEQELERMLNLVKTDCRITANSQRARNDHILGKLDTVVQRVIKQNPKLQKKDEVKVLLFLGAMHRPVFYGLRAAGKDVERTFSHSPYTFDLHGEGVNRYLFNKPISDELASKILAEFVIQQDLNTVGYDSHFDSQKTVEIERILLSHLTDEEIKTLFTQNPYGQTYIERMRDILGVKGLYIPTTGSQVNIFLRDYEGGKRRYDLNLKGGRETLPLDYTTSVGITFAHRYNLVVGTPENLDIETEGECIIAEGTRYQRKEKPNYRTLQNGESVVLGRENPEGFNFDDTTISRKHVRITRKGTDIIVEDLNSTNGTRVHFEKTEKQPVIVFLS